MILSTADYAKPTVEWGFTCLMKQRSLLLRFLNALLAPRLVNDSIVEVETITVALITTNSDSSEPKIEFFPIDEFDLGNETVSMFLPFHKVVVYDIACLTRQGLWIKVEMQRVHLQHHMDLAISFTSQLISRLSYKHQHVVQGSLNPLSNTEYASTYYIGILDFLYFLQPIVGNDSPVASDSWLIWNDLAVNGNLSLPQKPNGTTHTGQLNFIFITLSRFNELLDDYQNIETERDQLIWCLANLGKTGNRAWDLPKWFASFEKDFNVFKLDNLDDVSTNIYRKEAHQANMFHDEMLSAYFSGFEKGVKEAKEKTKLNRSG